jgi:Secretion system C-terminal sorting domain
MIGKMITCAFLLGFILNSNNEAQTEITYHNQSIRIGDSHHFTLAEVAGEGFSGPNQIWDFTSLKATGEMTSLMLNPSETVDGTLFPESNAVIKEFDNNFYFKVSDSEILDEGFASKGVAFKYDKPLVKLKFPLIYGSIEKGEFEGSNLNSPGVTQKGTYQITVDAFGKLLLPGNITFDDVVRLKSVRTEISGNSNNSVIAYRWYTTNVRYPLLTIIKSETGGKSVQMVTAYYSGTSSVQKIAQADDHSSTDAEIFFSVYPVPFSEELNIEYNLSKLSSVKIELLDNYGELVKTIVDEKQVQGQHKETFSGQQPILADGNYYIRVLIDGKEWVKKIIKII